MGHDERWRGCLKYLYGGHQADMGDCQVIKALASSQNWIDPVAMREEFYCSAKARKAYADRKPNLV